MLKAFNIVPPRFEDGRHEAFSAGLRRLGYDVIDQRLSDPEAAARAEPTSPHDVLVTWNLHLRGSEAAANRFHKFGARVIVCEEGYTRRLVAQKHFAMALWGHNGSGQWFPGGPERFERLGLKLKPWRKDGRHILVCSQRGMGSMLMRQPPQWPHDVMARLRLITDRPIVHRPHPGKRFHEVASLQSQLRDCWAVVIWASNCGIAALVAGVPVFHEAPYLVDSLSCRRDIENIDLVTFEELTVKCAAIWRQRGLEKMAWAQWTPEEIANGDPFRHLLRAEG